MKRLKLVKRGLLVIVLLLVVGGVVVYFYLDSLVKRTIETQATQSLHLQTTLGGTSLSVFGGKFGMSDLKVANPEGFTAPHMLTLGDARVNVSYGQLRNNPVHVANITLDRPTLVIEQVNGVFNFKRAQDGMSPTPPPTAPDGSPPAPQPPTPPQPSQPAGPAEPAKEQMKVIIDELTVSNAVVVLRPGLDLPVVPKEITIPVGSITMRNIGNGDGAGNGAAMKDVAMQLITALAAQANSSGKVPAELQALLNGDLSSVMNRLGAEAQQRVLAAVPGEAGQVLSKLVADPAALTKDPGTVVGGALDGLMGELKGKLPPIPGMPGGPTTGPSANPLDDPAKTAGDALGGLLGGKKDKSDKKDKAKK